MIATINIIYQLPYCTSMFMSNESIQHNKIGDIFITLTQGVLRKNYLRTSRMIDKGPHFRDRCLDETHTTLALAICCSYSGKYIFNSPLSAEVIAFPYIKNAGKSSTNAQLTRILVLFTSILGSEKNNLSPKGSP